MKLISFGGYLLTWLKAYRTISYRAQTNFLMLNSGPCSARVRFPVVQNALGF